jgi:hypothetical protein
VEQRQDERWLVWAASTLYLSVELVLIVSMYAAAFGWRPAAFVMIGALGVIVLSHLTVGVVSYRRTMARPWPRVSPLDDDDW